jgi:hypothetical protein
MTFAIWLDKLHESSEERGLQTVTDLPDVFLHAVYEAGYSDNEVRLILAAQTDGRSKACVAVDSQPSLAYPPRGSHILDDWSCRRRI